MGQDKEKDEKRIFNSVSALISRWRDGSFTEITDDWKWILTYSIRYKGAIAFYLVLGILSTTMGLASSVITKHLIDIIVGRQVEKLAVLIAVFIGSNVFSIVFNSVINRITARLNVDINNDIQADIFDSIIDSEWLSLNHYSTGDILNRFSNDIGTVSSNAIDWLPKTIIAVYQFLSTFLLIMHYDAVMALIALASAPFMLLASKLVLGRQREYGKKTRQVKSKVMHFEVETFQSFDTIKSLGITDHYSRKLRDWQQKYKSIFMDYNLFSIKTNVFMSLVGLGVQFASLAYCLFLLWNGSITYGTMTLFMQQRSNLSGAFNTLAGLVPTFLNSSISAHRVKELVDLPKEIHLAKSLELEPYAEHGLTVEMKDTTFAYGEGANVITDSSFQAKPGEIVALVGPSGEGKTTMIRLILGLMRPQEGQVVMKAGGRVIEMNAEIRHLMTYVPQGNTVLSGTIAENLRTVREDASDEEVIEALKAACAWEFVQKLPEGIYSSVGERGRGLSEGQAQRIAIARAIMRDAPVILMDEATSALDVATERRVLKNILQGDPCKTIIVTTHRPTVLGICSRVYRVMETKVTSLTEEEAARMSMDF